MATRPTGAAGALLTAVFALVFTAFALNEFAPVLYAENRPSATAIQWWVALWLAPATFLLLGGGPLVGVLLARRRTTS